MVDTVGFNDKFWFDYMGHPHTEKLHTIERYTRTDLGHMSIEVTIDDPGAYAKPFTTVGQATLMPGTELLEYICQENNQDLPLLDRPRAGSGRAVKRASVHHWQPHRARMIGRQGRWSRQSRRVGICPDRPLRVHLTRHQLREADFRGLICPTRSSLCTSRRPYVRRWLRVCRAVR